MITVLTYISILSGGLLVVLLLLSIIGGLDLDLDFDVLSTDSDGDAGGLGLVKGFLTLLSVSSWVIKILLTFENNPVFAMVIGICCGLTAVAFLHALLRLLLKNESNVNWYLDEAILKTGKVYLKIPKGENTGLVNVEINGVIRELAAKSNLDEEIPTGALIKVMGVEGNVLLVERYIDSLI